MSHSRLVGSVEVDDPRELISGEQPGIAAVASKRISPVSPSRPRYPHFGPRLFSAPFEFGHCFAPPASAAFSSRRTKVAVTIAPAWTQRRHKMIWDQRNSVEEGATLCLFARSPSGPVMLFV
ncbi:hypothetical protein QC764_0078220 [Podospora pseudoanserina]|uniref:Uncharacterized protein n=1 Tax=Podospora pseudoanserina TaxID=2609844 RepID=A0ABR0I5C2_9PEZI|nr:hypothetical protein QC764_0078220 [Podospora pseudoanserina]